MAGWCISVGCGLVAGLIIGLLFKCLNDEFTEKGHFFNDIRLFENDVKHKKQNKRENAAESEHHIKAKEI